MRVEAQEPAEIDAAAREYAQHRFIPDTLGVQADVTALVRPLRRRRRHLQRRKPVSVRVHGTVVEVLVHAVTGENGEPAALTHERLESLQDRINRLAVLLACTREFAHVRQYCHVVGRKRCRVPASEGDNIHTAPERAFPRRVERAGQRKGRTGRTGRVGTAVNDKDSQRMPHFERHGPRTVRRQIVRRKRNLDRRAAGFRKRAYEFDQRRFTRRQCGHIPNRQRRFPQRYLEPGRRGRFIADVADKGMDRSGNTGHHDASYRRELLHGEVVATGQPEVEKHQLYFLLIETVHRRLQCSKPARAGEIGFTEVAANIDTRLPFRVRGNGIRRRLERARKIGAQVRGFPRVEPGERPSGLCLDSGHQLPDRPAATRAGGGDHSHRLTGRHVFNTARDVRQRFLEQRGRARLLTHG